MFVDINSMGVQGASLSSGNAAARISLRMQTS
jgi:hypothetical protein